MRLKKAFIKYCRGSDIVNYLERNRGFTFDCRDSMYHCRERIGLAVKNDRQSWRWRGKGARGHGVLDYLMKAENMTFQEAIEDLAGKAKR